MEKIRPANDKVLSWIKKALKEAHKDKQGYSKTTRESLNKSLELIENRIDKIYDDKIDEVITLEYYNKRFKEYRKQSKDIQKQLGTMENNINHYYEVGVEIHDLAYKAKRLYLSDKATPDYKRTLINKIFASLQLKDKKLITEYKPAYQFLSEWMPKLNATSELLKQTEEYKKTGAFAPAHPLMLGDRDSNPDTQDQNLMSYH